MSVRQHSGEIGTLTCGKQIGGFLDWTIDLRMISLERQDGRVYKALTSAKAAKHWFLEAPTGEITANYYLLCGDTLALVNSHTIEPVTGPVGKMLGPLEMIWTS